MERYKEIFRGEHPVQPKVGEVATKSMWHGYVLEPRGGLPQANLYLAKHGDRTTTWALLKARAAWAAASTNRSSDEEWPFTKFGGGPDRVARIHEFNIPGLDHLAIKTFRSLSAKELNVYAAEKSPPTPGSWKDLQTQLVLSTELQRSHADPRWKLRMPRFYGALVVDNSADLRSTRDNGLSSQPTYFWAIERVTPLAEAPVEYPADVLQAAWGMASRSLGIHSEYTHYEPMDDILVRSPQRKLFGTSPGEVVHYDGFFPNPNVQ